MSYVPTVRKVFYTSVGKLSSVSPTPLTGGLSPEESRFFGRAEARLKPSQ